VPSSHDQNNRDPWLLVGVEHEVEELACPRAEVGPQAADSARRVAEELIARGHFRFSKVLNAT